MDDFYLAVAKRDGRPRRHRRCKPCHYRYTRRGNADLRANRRKHLYSMTPSEYAVMFAEQDGACAICRAPAADDDGRGLHVDHDHANGAKRGLLCDSCNQGLGRFRDNPDDLRAAANYLDQHWQRGRKFPTRLVARDGVTYLASAMERKPDVVVG